MFRSTSWTLTVLVTACGGAKEADKSSRSAISSREELQLLARASARGPDVTSSVEVLGNPTAARYGTAAQYYARNPWQLSLFENKIYMGSGNSSNVGPAPNAGPADLWSYNLASRAFVNETRFQEEQIEKFRILDGVLSVPGHDRRGGSWDAAAFYQLVGTTWKENYTIPNAVHNYDLASYRNKLFAAIAPKNLEKPVMYSEDGGTGWREVSYASSCLLDQTRRVFTLWTFNRKLYASGIRLSNLPWSTTKYAGKVYETAGTTLTGSDTNWFAGLGEFQGTTTPPLVVRPLKFLDSLAYIAAINVNDHQWTPKKFMIADAAGTTRTVALTGGALPWDIKTSGAKLYVLGAIKTGTQYTVTVTSTADLISWVEEFRFTSDTFARSFEVVGNEFFFGLGSEHQAPTPLTGTLVRVNRASL